MGCFHEHETVESADKIVISEDNSPAACIAKCLEIDPQKRFASKYSTVVNR